MKSSKIRDISFDILSTNYSNRFIALKHQVSPTTVKKYRLNLIKGMPNQDVSELIGLSDTEIKGKVNKAKSKMADKIMPDYVEVHKRMQTKHATRVQIWAEYKEEYKERAYSESQFNKYYRDFLNTLDVTMRKIHYPAQSAELDFCGTRIPWFNPKTNTKQFAEVFVGVLPYSSYTFALAVDSQKLADWIHANNEFLFFLGGVPEVLIPDNLKSAVISAGRFPSINKTFEDQGRHFDTSIIPTRPRKPKDKGAVENAVKIVSRWIISPLLRMHFEGIEDINREISKRLEILNNRNFKRIEGSRYERFIRYEKPLLKSLPSERYQFLRWTSPQKVNSDYHVCIDGHWYSVPYHLTGKTVEARIGRKTIEIFHDGLRIAIHIVSNEQGSSTTDNSHRHPRHQMQADKTYFSYVEWAKGISEPVLDVVKHQFKDKSTHSLKGLDACSKLKSLGRTYGEERLVQACLKALRIKSPTVKSIKSMLDNNIEFLQEDLFSAKSQIPSHTNVRGSGYFGGDSYVE